MRDDLHRTVGVSRRWQRVLRHAQSKMDRPTRLPASLSDAARLTLKDSIRSPWLDGLRSAVREGASDLFGQERLVSSVREFAGIAATPLEREVAECVRGRAVFHRSGSDPFVGAMREVAERVVERSCEQLVARVRADHPKDAAELRRVLATAQHSCDISSLIDAAGGISGKSIVA